MNLQSKLAILADAAKYDASCASSGAAPRNSVGGRGMGSTEGMGICHSYAPDGRCISLLKILLSMPQELTNAQGQVIWQASYKTWGSTVAEEWKIKTLAGNPIHKLDEGDSPDKADQQQNLRFQGQYLDRDTGLHYNTFRYYDPDVGRFICPDPIGLAGGINLGSYAPNPITWIDPWGWACAQANQQQGNMGRDALANRLKNSRRYEVLDTEVTIKTPGHTTATGKTGSRRADIVVRDRKTGEIIQVEVKTGAAARDKTQLSKDAEISLGGGTSGNTTWGSKKLEPYGIGKGTNTGPIRTIEVTVDPNTGKIL